MRGISIKATTITGTRSRGRVATSTRTILRNVDPDLHPYVIMSVMSLILPLLERMPASYLVRGVRYEVLGVATRTVRGLRMPCAVFKDERALRKSYAREMRRLHRASRRNVLRETRTAARRRMAVAAALLALSRAAHIVRTAPAHVARAPMLVPSSLYISAPTARPLSAIPYG